MTAISIYSFVDIYRRALATADHLLTKGSAHAVDTGGQADDILGWRLAEDMHPLSFQCEVVINFARNWIARAADLPVPDSVSGADLSLDQIHAEIGAAQAWLGAVTPDHLAGRDDAPITFKIGDIMEPTLPAGQWLTGFATTNVHFHLSMIYAILRMKGVKLGKVDMFPTGL